MREIFIRDDVTKVCEKNVYQINFEQITFQKIFWDGSINVIEFCKDFVDFHHF